MYSATKYFVEALTQGLRLEIVGSGVKVTSIQPGMIINQDCNLVRGGEWSARKVTKCFAKFSSNFTKLTQNQGKMLILEQLMARKPNNSFRTKLTPRHKATRISVRAKL